MGSTAMSKAYRWHAAKNRKRAEKYRRKAVDFARILGVPKHLIRTTDDLAALCAASVQAKAMEESVPCR